jgi:hypothetical protein
MLTLVLGEVEVPYDHRPPAPKRVAKARPGKQRRRKRSGGGVGGAKTTADVAKILEQKYGLFQLFYTLHQADIAQALADGMGDALASIMAGAPLTIDPHGAAMETIRDKFVTFLETEEAAGYIAGVPTAAALKGVNHRLKRPYKKSNPRRPSFIDSSQMETAFVAWITGG